MRDGVVEQVEPGLVPATDAPGVEVIDVQDRLVLPGLVDAHCHLDKTLYGEPWVPHSAGDALADRIADERRRRGELGGSLGIWELELGRRTYDTFAALPARGGLAGRLHRR